MTRETLDHKLQELLDDTLALGTIVEHAILHSVEALKARDIEMARKIYQKDKDINHKRFEIENGAIIAIATQQPMAMDLRILASVLDVAGELERIGDYAKGIALITIRMGDEPPIKPLIDIPKMAELTADMLHRALSAFVEYDAQKAVAIPEEDDQVDGLYNQVYRELLTYMISDPSTIDRATYLLWVAHNLERAADRVTNICERTIYIATGKRDEIDSSDDEALT
ncbi:MAG: phosphate signaling complex protein PhoU [Chloroflexi bacterium]|nr:phosphate signaling complex protein PhoU [Chloroflexota bacterium]